MKWKRGLSAGLSLLLWAGAAHGGRYDSDRPGAADHPLVSRYAGSTLFFHGGESYSSAPMLVKETDGLKVRQVEGRISNRLYWGPQGRGSAEVFHNYEAAFRAAGFEAVYRCEPAQCKTDRTQQKITRWVDKARWSDRGNDNYYLVRAFQAKPAFHYLHVRKAGPKGTVHVQVALRDADDNDRNVPGRVMQFVQIVEPAAVEMGQVTVDAAAIGSALSREGKIALYGVLFDTNDARIKPESSGALVEMAAALKNDPGLNVFIVGHTDNQGNVEANLALSRRRAQAVVDALVRQHGIGAGRLQAQGAANFAPLASNASDEGRAKNRRVEMVVR